MTRGLLCAFSAVALHVSVLAQGEVVVTATREDSEVLKTPYAVNLFSDELLRLEKTVRTLPEAMQYQPGTMVQKTAHGQGSPYIRGFTGFRNLMMVDGVRLNNSVFRDGPNQYWNTVDVHGLSRIESVRGPFSVLYGSDAVGGTVNAFTRGVRDLRSGSRWDKRLFYRYSDAGNSHVTRLESIGYVSDSSVVTAGYSLKDFGNTEGGKDVGTQEKTGYDEHDWNIKLEQFVDDDTLLVIAHQGVGIEDAWRTHKTIYGIDWKGLSVGKELRRSLDQDRMLTYAQIHQVNRGGAVSEVHAGVSHHLQSETRDRIRTGDRYDEQGFDVNTLGSFVQLASQSTVGDLLYGVEYYRDDVDSYKNTLNPEGTVKSRSIQGPVADDAVYDALSAFLQDTVAAGESLSAVLGLRYDYMSADADSVEDPDSGERISLSDNWDEVTGSGRLLYEVDRAKKINFFAGISQGFRAPNLSDLTRLDSARTDEIETPSPDLEPEEFVSYEVGVKVGHKKFRGQLTAFYTDVDNLIIRTPTGKMIEEEHEVTKRNSGRGYVKGMELDCFGRLTDELDIYGIFTWMDGEIDTYPTSDAVAVREPIDRLMPVTGTVGLRWHLTKNAWVEAEVTAADDADKLSSRDKSDTSRIPPGGTPGYTVFDLRSSVQVRDDLVVTIALENVGDEDYRIHGSGLNEPGRNLILAAELTM